MRFVASIMCVAWVLVAGCGDNLKRGSDKQVTSFELLAADNPGLAHDVGGLITGTTITVVVPARTDVTHLVARFDTSGAKVAVDGAAQRSGTTANDFSAPVTYTVTAADNSTKDYVVTVQVAAADAKAITDYRFETAHNPGLGSDLIAIVNGNVISVIAPFGTDVTALVATFTTTGTGVAVGGTAQVSGTTANDFTSPVVYTVTAADGSTATYTVTVSIAPDHAKSITAYSFLSADNPALAADVTATINGALVSATVPFGTDVTALVATFSTTGTSVSVGATAQVSGVTANNFTNPVHYTVTAGDGSTVTYTVTVTIAPSTAKDITAYAFMSADNPGLAADVIATLNGTTIAATVPFGTDVTALVATFSTTGTNVAVGGTAQVSGVTPNDFTSPVTYTVTAADSSTKAYTVTVTIAGSPAKDLTAFSFQSTDNPGLSADVVATITGTSITATLPFGTDVTALVATFATTGASVAVGATAQTSGITPNDFTGPVVYTVTAADNSTKDYTVTVTIAASPAKDITVFAFLSASNPGLPANVTATITNTSIAATVPFGTDVTALVATFVTTGASVGVGTTVQASGITANDFTNPVTYTVTAADGSTQDYTVTVSIASSAAKDLTAFSLLSVNNPSMSADATGTITGTTIAVTVPFGTDPTALVATFTTTGTSVSVGTAVQASGFTANDFTNPVTYTVTAADSSTQDYTVTVTVALNPAKDLTSFQFLAANNPSLPTDITATITGTAIVANVPVGANIGALVASFTTTGASVAVQGTAQVSGVSANDFSDPVFYVVTAADGSTQMYTVSVIVQQAATISAITVVSTSPDNGATPYNTGTTTVQIAGTSFTGVACPAGVALVDLDGLGNAVDTHPTGCTVDSDSQITATFPAGIRTNGAAGWSIVVTNISGASAPSTATFVPVAGVLISEVLATGSSNAHEFLELYNPTANAIDGAAIGLKLHIRNGMGTSDTQKPLTLVTGSTGVLPSHGFVLLMGSGSTSADPWFSHADYTYTSTSNDLVTNGGAYISLSTTAQTKVIDKAGWGTQTAGGFEGAGAMALPANQSIQRMLPTDTDNNAADFAAPSTSITPMGSMDPPLP